MIWTKFKLYGLAIIGLIVTGLGIAVRVLSAKNSKLTRKVETAEARVEHQKAVIRADKEIQANEQARETQIVNDLRDGKSDYDPNSLFITKDDD